ncbi:MAG: endo-1,4-beta-xylanase [Pseudomonadales bacterium]
MYRRRFIQAVSAAAGLTVLSPAKGQASSYKGMEEGASWRKQALARIERHRKTDFHISVNDAQGNPISGVDVELRLRRHEFGFGAAVRPQALFGNRYHRGDSEEYRKITSHYFHRLTVENGMKWKHQATAAPLMEPFLDWCLEEDLPVRGHCLVWPKFIRIPPELHKLRDDPAMLDLTIDNYIKNMLQRYGAPLIEWDVLNEPRTHTEFMEILGPKVVDKWFSLAQQYRPELTRYINEYGVLTRNNPNHRQQYYDYIQTLLDRGVPLQGIGFQSHIPAAYAPTPPSELLAILDEFSSFGLDLQVTEFDFETKNKRLQAIYTMDFMIAVFSHPATKGLVTWTPYAYGDNSAGKLDAAMFDRDLSELPNGRIWNDMVNGVWTTRVNAPTNLQGQVDFRGFHGKYDVRLKAGKRTISQRVVLNAKSREAVLTL